MRLEILTLGLCFMLCRCLRRIRVSCFNSRHLLVAALEDESGGGDPLGDDEWLNLTSDDFDELCSKW